MSDINISVREFERDGDLNFVMNSILKSFRSSWETKHLTNAVYFKYYHQLLTDIIGLPNTKLLIACLPEDSTQILAFIVCDRSSNTLIYSYVKKPYRRMGMFKNLMNYSGLDLSKTVRYIFSPFNMPALIMATAKDIRWEFIPAWAYREEQIMVWRDKELKTNAKE
ncbi:MAG: hypothetical protein LLG04_07275 [Parachlamydia sp.]|nr:hypothetical protein [Parachlamydia sp.]